jgi:multiple sugar transport system substrate-binding protein/sn-glycerol 3-phosphate transport system substrate-binding protein
MSKKGLAWVLFLVLALSLLAAACSSAATEEPPVVPSIDPSGQTVTFWHVWASGDTGEGLVALVDEFNATNEWGITVDALAQGRYNDLEDAMNAAIQSGDTPDIVVGYTNILDTWYAVDVLEDMNAFVSDPDWGLTSSEISDFYSGAWNSGVNGDGVRVGFPHGQSANVMFYNYTWGEELGFSGPPETWAEFKEQTCAAADANAGDADPDNDGTGGFVLYTGASEVSTFIFAFGENYINADGTGYDFTKPGIAEVAGNLKELWDEGCAFATESYPNPEFATRKALIVMSSTAGYPYQVGAFEAEDAFNDDVWGFIPVPGDTTKAVDAYGQNSAIVKSNPERELAAWLFVKWFTSPEINAKWIEASAYHPIRQSTVDFLDEYVAANPGWADGIELLSLGVGEPAWASWSSVRRSVQDTFAAIIQGDPGDIPGLLEELNATAADALAETQ